MSNKIIFIPYAYVQGKRSGANMAKSADAFCEYCATSCVALVSLKRHNPDCDVALVTNEDIPETYAGILSKNNILIIHVPFDSFSFPDDYPWSLAFYKLCALKAMIENAKYEYFCYLDVDVIANRPLDEVWMECDHNIMLYNINHGLQVPNYVAFSTEARSFDSSEAYITQYGGEFFAANRKNAAHFLADCESIYSEMRQREFITTRGDEFIIALAASRNKQLVKNAGAYIYRFWTGSFRLVSTCYEFNPVAIMHLPAEKSSGFIKLFNRFIAKGKYPTNEQIYKICRLRNPRLSSRIAAFVKRLLR